MKKKYFYILSENDNSEIKALKIGITDNLENRLITVQSNNSNEIKIEHFEEREDAFELERWLLGQLKKNHKRGEWFIDLKVKEIRKKIFEFYD